jgi:RNA polymerase sigma factor (sigma-70 family)
MDSRNNFLPQTAFPEEPKDRWKGWKGILNAGDDVYIFTKSIQDYLLLIFEHKGIKDRLNEEDAKEIASDTLRLTMNSMKTFLLNRTVEERTISKSLDDFVFSFLWISYKHVKYIHIQKEKNDLVFDEKLIHLQVSSINIHRETLNAEILDQIQDCFSRLKEKYKRVMIAYCFDGYTIKEIAERMNLEQHEIKNSYNKGRSETRDCLTRKGFRDYLNG